MDWATHAASQAQRYLNVVHDLLDVWIDVCEDGVAVAVEGVFNLPVLRHQQTRSRLLFN